VLLWLGTKRRRSTFATKSHTFTHDEIVYLVRFKLRERRHLYALGVERRDAHRGAHCRASRPKLKEICHALER
jgi:hypothetical protein